MNDLEWLRKEGFETFLKETGKPIAAICGGYQMMFERISDTEAIEADEPASVRGLGFLKGEVCFEREKSVKKGLYSLFGLQIEGYEIHNGMVEPLWVQKEKFYGTFVHGIFDNNDFRGMLFSQINPVYRGFDFQAYKEESIRSFAAHVEENMDLDRLMKALIE
jgi:adenosylcobyric acid synthase